MTPRDRILFESVAGDLLRDLGYETEGRVRKVTPPERWLWGLDHRLRWLARRLNRQDYYRELVEAVGKRGAMLAHRVRARLGSLSKSN